MRSIRILFVTPYVPSILRPRPFNLLKALRRRGHRVTLVALATSRHELRHVDAIAPFCDAVRVVRIGRVRSLWNCLRATVSGAPLQAFFCHSPAADRFIREELLGRRGDEASTFDVLHVEHLRAAVFGLSQRGVVRVFDSVDCITQLLTAAARHGSSPLIRFTACFDLERTRRYERIIIREFDQVLASSAAEIGHIARLFDQSDAPTSRLHALQNGVDLEYFQPTNNVRAAAEVVFVGRMGYHANIAAAHQLLAEIMPRVWKRRPGTQLSIVGEGPPGSLRALAARQADRVRLTGYVDDVRPYLARATVVVCPLVYAVGIQNKVLEAMAMEAPVIASPVACAALDVRDGEHVLIARDAEEFAFSIDRVLQDPALARRVGASGRRYVSSQHDWEVVASRLELLYWEQMRVDEAGGR